MHSEHPFLEPEGSRDPARRFRARVGGAVTLWTVGGDAAGDADRAGLTVSSLMVAHGDPAHVLALVDPDSSFVDVLGQTGRGVVQLLGWGDRDLADAFAGTAPAPGGPFRMASWQQTPWGPVLASASAWAGFTVARPPAEVGWSLLLDGVVEEIHVGEAVEPLVHRRGRYVRPS
ncbi:MAG: flavin reductase family protein [Nocardioides sp.]